MTETATVVKTEGRYAVVRLEKKPSVTSVGYACSVKTPHTLKCAPRTTREPSRAMKLSCKEAGTGAF